MQSILPGGDSRLLTRVEVIDAVRRLTGVSVKPNTIAKWTNRGCKGRRLRSYRIGKRSFHTEADLIAFLAHQQEGGETGDAEAVIGALLGRQYAEGGAR